MEFSLRSASMEDQLWWSSQLVAVNFWWPVIVLVIFKALGSFAKLKQPLCYRFISSSWAKCIIDVVSCLHCFITILKLNNKSAQICFLSNIISVCRCCSVTKSCLTVCNPIDSSMLGFPVLHHLSEFAHDHVYCIGDAINHFIPCHLLLLPTIFLSISVFQWVSSLNQVAKAFELQHQSS